MDTTCLNSFPPFSYLKEMLSLLPSSLPSPPSYPLSTPFSAPPFLWARRHVNQTHNIQTWIKSIVSPFQYISPRSLSSLLPVLPPSISYQREVRSQAAGDGGTPGNAGHNENAEHARRRPHSPRGELHTLFNGVEGGGVEARDSRSVLLPLQVLVVALIWVHFGRPRE